MPHMPLKIDPALADTIMAHLRKGYFRQTVLGLLELSQAKWDNLMSHPTFRARVLKAEAEFFLAFQDVWLRKATESMAKGDLNEMKEFAGKRFAEMGQMRGSAPGEPQEIKISVRHFTATPKGKIKGKP